MARIGPLLAAVLLASLATTWGPPVQAATCNVPSVAYPTIELALADGSCTDIVLAAQTYLEAPVIDHSLTMRGDAGGGTVIEDQVQVTSGTVTLQDMTIGVSSPFESNRYESALSVSGGAQVTGSELVVLQAVAQNVFSDNFEFGNTDKWSNAVALAPNVSGDQGEKETFQ